MQISRSPQCLLGLASRHPTVGDLMTLCEENYVLLSRLAPGLKELREVALSRRQGCVDLYLIIEEQSRYTSLIRLTHLFQDVDLNPVGGMDAFATWGGVQAGTRADPDARLRIYHDARQVEVLDLRQTVLPLHLDYQPPALDSKWRANLFLGKWLSFCLQQGHRFGTGRVPLPLTEGGDLIDTLTE